jgi:hypothetical protein
MLGELVGRFRPSGCNLGGLALYWVRLWYGPATATFFPLTGYDFVNVALLACGAAAIGMVISLVATICMGVVQYGIRKSDVLKYYTGLEGALQKYRQLLRPTEPPPQDNLNKIEL